VIVLSQSGRHVGSALSPLQQPRKSYQLLRVQRKAWSRSKRLTYIRQRGSATVEYAVVTGVVVATLFLPLPGLGESLVDTLITALRQFQDNSTFLLSLP
jgi:hypothetical protein